MSDLREFFERLVYQAVGQRRFTQQSPVMPDVWIRYGMDPGRQAPLLLVPDWHHTPVDLARALKRRLAADAGDDRLEAFRPRERERADVAFNQNAVVATLCFDELVRAVLPLSPWWKQAVSGIRAPGDDDRLAAALEDRPRLTGLLADLVAGRHPDADELATPDTVWLARVVGFLALLARERSRAPDAARGTEAEQVEEMSQRFEDHPAIAQALVELLDGIEPLEWESETPLYTVNRNRATSTSLYDSVASVKGDATQRVFDVTGATIRWAVVDSGIDATHVAFRRRDAGGAAAAEPFPARAPGRRRGRRAAAATGYRNETRVIASYDFRNVRRLLSADPGDVDDPALRADFPLLEDAAMRRELAAVLESLRTHNVEWERLQPFLEIPHHPAGAERAYRAPVHAHGTHVAGIIAGDWRVGDPGRDPPPSPRGGEACLRGVSPGIELYDLRVLGDDGSGDEFSIMSALQFVRDLNNRKNFVAVHGVNLSFSIEHDVANYACGRTPVCEEAERLVGSGVTVVAAAGNSGRARYLTPAGVPDDGFRTVSITDPGNADGVITVGSTHRRDPHTYGVSYFSSRGPTGDGRLKPDLVAPGEKIQSTVPGNADDRLDGTSMAAPHVSGACALIMERHPELVGQPRRIKQILCDSATDLGRERYFQGAGLLDVLRALESV